ncbi:cardiolipin synthase ASCRUDRAFT_76302 [Ascoidea rubescens DSM 1968]|uniref:Cardiolipin synthase n=1 Tax=Ascoidea rubescens DSM 1968 TaxID=1344418 RepID=A0A1D2VF33_9ASCO|nr:hypothetical protein ASCRUDRAFT_76302 [Ascoidea rubescens DSM 1968]ODV60284.1 hypothetical protein ASCRUDRAFT_76302 [Ascoidea rubescens DSM 1968]
MNTFLGIALHPAVPTFLKIAPRSILPFSLASKASCLSSGLHLQWKRPVGSSWNCVQLFRAEAASFSRAFATSNWNLQLASKTLAEMTKEKFKTRQKQIIDKTKQIQKNIVKPLKKVIPEHENIYTIPNILTFTRLASAPLIGYLIANQHVLSAFLLFGYSCVTDFVDGYIARKYNMGSVLGSVIDPMADKLLMIICTGCLTYSNTIPLYLAILILGRDGLLGLSAIYFRYISLPLPRTFLRFWDFSIPSAEVHPTTISKYNTFFQMLYIACCVVQPVVYPLLDQNSLDLIKTAFTGLEYLTATTTVLSGLSYIFSKNAVEILHKPSIK